MLAQWLIYRLSGRKTRAGSRVVRAVRRARGRDPIQDSVCPEECRNPRLGRFQASCVSIMSNRETSDSVHPSGNKTPLGRPGLGCGALPSGQGDHTDGEGQSEGEAVDDLGGGALLY